jgi:hypothetical protein
MRFSTITKPHSYRWAFVLAAPADRVYPRTAFATWNAYQGLISTGKNRMKARHGG